MYLDLILVSVENLCKLSNLYCLYFCLPPLFVCAGGIMALGLCYTEEAVHDNGDLLLVEY